MKKHKYSIDQKVYDTWTEEVLTVVQLRVENGHLCYRLSDGRIVNENKLKA